MDMSIGDRLAELEKTYHTGLVGILDDVRTLGDVASLIDHVANMASGPIHMGAFFVGRKLDQVAEETARTHDARTVPVQDAQLRSSHIVALLPVVETLGGETVREISKAVESGLSQLP